MNIRCILSKVRDGMVHHRELSGFAQDCFRYGVSDAQAGAFAMAVCVNGLTERGTLLALPLAMRDQWESSTMESSRSGTR